MRCRIMRYILGTSIIVAAMLNSDRTAFAADVQENVVVEETQDETQISETEQDNVDEQAPEETDDITSDEVDDCIIEVPADGMKNTWYQEDDFWFYYDENGELTTGMATIDGSTYIFTDWGYMMTDFVDYDGTYLRYFGDNGKLCDTKTAKEGWNTIGGRWYYIQNGVSASGWQKIGGYWYYFIWETNPNLYVMIHDDMLWVHEDERYFFDSNGRMITGWYKNPYGDWYYFDKDGKMALGVREINGTKYLFDSWMIANRIYLLDGWLYYCDANGKVTDGVKAKEGWNKLNGKWTYIINGDICYNTIVQDGSYKYYIDYDGFMASQVYNIWFFDEETQSSKEISIDEKGRLRTGWHKRDGAWHYYTDGEEAVNECKLIGGKYYNFDWSGQLMVNDTFYVNGKLYHTNMDGTSVVYNAAKTGWVEDTYYIENGIVVTGMKKIDGFYYIFDDDGKKITSQNAGLLVPHNGERYCLDYMGRVRTGWIETSNATYWADKDGKIYNYGYKTIDGKQYYFEDGVMQTGLVRDDNNVLQKIDSKGVCKGTVTERSAWLKFEGAYYYIDLNGNPYVDTVQKINGKYYAFDRNGAMIANAFYDDMYFGSNGAAYQNQWLEIQVGKWMYFGDDCKPVSDGFVEIAGKTYHFTDSYMDTGDVEIDGKIYRFGTNGVCTNRNGEIVNGWYQKNGMWRYRKDGVDLVSRREKIGNDIYYFDWNGNMAVECCDYGEYLDVTGRRTIGYYFGKDGKMIKNGWYKTAEGKWYYADSDGKLYEGLKTVGGKQYLFGTGYTYCAMATSSCVSIDRTEFYEIGSNGVVTKVIKASKCNGWVRLSDGRWIYARDGKFSEGMEYINGKYYYFDDGIMMSDGWYSGFSGNSTFFTDKDGVVKTDGWTNAFGVWFYVKEGKFIDGAYTYAGKEYYSANADSCYEGIAYVDGLYYWYNGAAGGRSVVKYTDGWNKINGKWYYVVNNEFVTGLYKVNGTWYYFDQTTFAMVYDDIIDYYPIDDEWNYIGFAVGADGVLLKNAWKRNPYYSNAWLYYDANGIKVSGEQVINGKKYTFTSDGVLIQ